MATGQKTKMVKQFINQLRSTRRSKVHMPLNYDVHYWNAEAKPFNNKDAFIQIIPSVNPLTLRKVIHMKFKS